MELRQRINRLPNATTLRCWERERAEQPTVAQRLPGSGDPRLEADDQIHSRSVGLLPDHSERENGNETAAGKAAPPQAKTPEQPVDANREGRIEGSSARFLFEIEAGPLRTVLAEFESVSGWQVSAADDEILNLQSPGVQGQFSAEGALSRLLNGIGVRYELTAPTAAIVRSMSG